MQQIFATLYSFVAVAKTRAEEEKGATAVEYGLLGGKLNGLFDQIQKALPGGAATPAAG